MAENISLTILALQTDYPPPENIKVTFQTGETEAQTKEPTKSETFKTTKHIAAKIIGIGGERIRKIKTLYTVEIHPSETADDERKFTVTGNSQNVTKALRIIKNVAKETDEHDRELHTRSQYTNAPNPRHLPKYKWHAGTSQRGSGKKEKNYTTRAQQMPQRTLTQHPHPLTETTENPPQSGKSPWNPKPPTKSPKNSLQLNKEKDHPTYIVWGGNPLHGYRYRPITNTP